MFKNPARLLEIDYEPEYAIPSKKRKQVHVLMFSF